MRLLYSKPNLLKEKCLNGCTLGDCLRNISFMFVQTSRVPQYPECAHWFSHTNIFCKPCEAKDASLCFLVGAVMPTVICSSEQINSCFLLKTPPRVSDVLLQLDKIKDSYSNEQRSDIMPMLKEIYTFLNDNQDDLKTSMSCPSDKEVICTDDGFVSAAKVTITHKDEDIDLRPYFYVLPPEFRNKRRLFATLGCKTQQDAEILQHALHCIKESQTRSRKKKFRKRDKNMVRNILDKLAYFVEHEMYSVDQSNTLMLVHNTSDHCLDLVPISSCVYDDDPGNFYDNEEYVYFVHEIIHPKTAEVLGVKSISKKALLNAEELGVEDWGQNEKLTIRLKALLDEGYTDGVSVPKELIQNADDAGAKTIKFLYDERQNTEARKRVFSKEMKNFQGPALWIYNDSLFTDDDLQNITMLNAATKETDVRKIGKFGLGFCSVYNLTDIPSFISGKNIVFFDPHETHFSAILRHRSRGLKYRLPNKTLVSRYTDQFKPYDGVFGCNIADDAFSQYNGTLFRLPLRTEQQASESEISVKAYTKREMLKLLEMFMKAAGNFLMFSQNVKSIEIHHLPSNARNVSETSLLYKLNKDVLVLENGMPTKVNESVLSRLPHVLENDLRFSEIHEAVFSQKLPNSTKKIIRGVDKMPTRSNTTWIIAWATGIDTSLIMHKGLLHRGSVPLSAVAVPFDAYNSFDIRNASCGFYRDGHLFCFLPLPLTTKLPVHLNGCFAVSSSRRQLATLTEDDKDSKKNAWNVALMEDASVIAQVNLLKALAANDLLKDRTYKYYALWPLRCDPLVQPFKEAFYRHIIESNEPVFKGSKEWIGYQDVTFLDPDISQYDFGELAFVFLSQFPPRAGKTLIKMPGKIYESIKNCKNLNKKNIQTAVIEERELFQHFLSNIHEPFWKKRLSDRNRLILAALNVNDATISHQMGNESCIPTAPNNKLSKVSTLIHPSSYLAKLFDEDEERFPLNTREFRNTDILKKLDELGMNDVTLPTQLFIERCASVSILASRCCSCAFDRSKNMLSYMCKKRVIYLLQNDSCAIEKAKETLILPVLQKPERWPFSWKANAKSPCIKHFNGNKRCTIESHRQIRADLILGKPKDLFRYSAKEYVGGVSFVLDETLLNIDRVNFNELCKLFDLKDKASLPLKIVVDQLQMMSRERKNKHQIKDVSKIHNLLFTYLNEVVESDMNEDQITILNELRSSSTILIGDRYVKAQHIAFDVKEECRPYLYRLPDQEQFTKKTLYGFLGVKQYFTVEDILQTMDKLYRKGRKSSEIEQANHLLIDLHEALKQRTLTYEDISQDHGRIVAPDIYLVFWPTHELVFENKRFETSTSMKIMHPSISQHIGISLGVKSKQLRCFEEFSIGIPFGQQERLVTRLRGLLKAYPRDTSIMRELLQNADDAGASEIHFIKDYRFHSTKNVFKTCNSLQGPSLCVYNNSYFKQEDIEGIHNLGQGSKKDDPTQTGQYGVGFNSVYHLTDTPSFLTKGPGIENGGRLIILDPLCTHVPNATLLEPGVMCNIDDIKQTPFSVLLLGFSVNELIQTDTGTVFRFPLRSHSSGISEEIVDLETMDTILKSFEDDLFEAVIFLKNITCIKISNLSSGKLEEEYSVKVELSQEAQKKRIRFNKQTFGIANSNKLNKDRNIESNPVECIYPMQVADSRDKNKHFLVVQRFGIDQTISTNKFDDVKQKLRSGHLGLLPIGGVAFPLDKCLIGERFELSELMSHSSGIGVSPVKKSTEASAYPFVIHEERTFTGRAYCFLPLPIETGLPIHINAHFALDHEARRELWKEGYRHSWNCFVSESLIVPTWASGLRHISELVQKAIEKSMSPEVRDILLENYYSYFPLNTPKRSQTWQQIADKFYNYVVTYRVPLFSYVFDRQYEIPPPDGIFDNSSLRFRVFWTCIDNCTNQYHNGIFNTIICHIHKSDLPKARDNEVYLIQQLLLAFGLKLITTPEGIRESMITAGFENIPTSTPCLVTSFIESNKNGNDESCNVGQINTIIHQTKYRTSNNLYTFLKYMVLDQSFYRRAEGVPVLLTADSILKKCSKKTPAFVSMYSSLLPISKSEFIHEDILTVFSDERIFLSDCFRRFTFADFVNLLPISMDVDTYTNKDFISIYNNDYKYGIISKKWLGMFYDFLCKQSFKDFPQVNDGEKIRENMKALHNWCLLPCLQSDAKHSLVPFSEAVHLLHLDEVQMQDTFGKALESLKLPTIDMTALEECEMRDVVESALIKCIASPDRPVELLYCLVYHRQTIKSCITAGAGNIILAFFERHLDTLLQQMDRNILKQILRKLPLFVTQEGTLADISCSREVFVLPETMPSAGLKRWACTCNVTLLRSNGGLKLLHEFLELHQTNIGYVYGMKILPMFDALPRESWLDHIDYIRKGLKVWSNEHQQNIINQLKGIAFINIRGEIKKANELYDSKNKIFQRMKIQGYFPPISFVNHKWYGLLKKLGMITDLNDEMLIDFAQQIETESANCLTQSVRGKSRLLYDRFVQNHGTDWQKETLHKLRAIRFIEPSVLDTAELDIWPQFDNAERLICFQNAISCEHWKLCWTSQALLSQDVTRKLSECVRKELGIHETPDLDIVILHCQNVIDSLKEKTKDKSVDVALVKQQMSSLYEYFVDRRDPKLKKRLGRKPFVHIPDDNSMVKASEVISDLDPTMEIKPFLFRAPKYYGKYHELFEFLGSKTKIMFCHYASIMNNLQSKCKDDSMHPAETSIAQCVLKGLIKLDVQHDESVGEVKSVCLPNTHLRLIDSKDILYSNSEIYQQRLQQNIQLDIFVGAPFVELTDSSTLEEVFKQWPAHLKPTFLTDIVTEKLCLEHEQHVTSSAKAFMIEQFLHSSEFANALFRVLKFQFSRGAKKVKYDAEYFEAEIAKRLQNARIIEIKNLRTVLEYSGKLINGSEIDIPFKLEHGPASQCTFYFRDINHDNTADISYILPGLMELVQFCAVGLESDSVGYLTSFLYTVDDPQKIPSILDHLNLHQYENIHVPKREYFPKPGTYVERQFIPFLEQTISPFFDYEYNSVAMELQDMETNADDDEGPVYIYVRIIREIEMPVVKSDLMRSYIVNTGNTELSTEFVPIYRLYRFVRKEKEPGREMQKYDTEPTQSKTLDAHCNRILQDLRDAWTLPEIDRKRIIRRLLLRWHPDKNQGYEKYSADVFSFIKIVMSRLENEENVTDNVAEEMKRGPSSVAKTSKTYYDNIDKRAKTYARSYYDNLDVYNKSEKMGPYSHLQQTSCQHPDHAEAKRWLRQAKCDVSVAEAMMTTAASVNGYNWICYTCHQACEKALKSARYSVDANTVPKGSRSHLLTSLTDDREVKDQVHMLEERLGSHAKFRYPDAVSRPKIPADMFDREDAEFSIGIAKRVIDFVEENIS